MLLDQGAFAQPNLACVPVRQAGALELDADELGLCAIAVLLQPESG
jgi:hypothetical protein